MKRGIRAVCGVLAILMIAAVLPYVSWIRADASNKTKETKTYDIAIAFDNSGSMYDDVLWSQAKYATEIFASMLDYDSGDRLTMFTMWDVTTDGKVDDKGKTSSKGTTRFEVTSKEDVDKISRMFTVAPAGTPFAPVTEAYAHLKNSKADEKWLIIMSDGQFTRHDRAVGGDSETFPTRQEILDLAGNGIKIQYLGFGSADTLKGEESKGFYTAPKKEDYKSGEAVDLKAELIKICNRIFKRNELPDKITDSKGKEITYRSGSDLTLDISMSKVIVFVQGDDAEIGGLIYKGKDLSSSDDDASVKVISDSGQRKYNRFSAGSYLGTDYYEKAKADETLAGQVVIFGPCEKGQYVLDYKDADKIQIFYEPDVELKVTVNEYKGKDKNGDPILGDEVTVDPDDPKIAAGEYVVSSKIIDAKTGDDLTGHPLLGENVTIVTSTKKSTDSNNKLFGKIAQIALGADASTEVWVEATYLDDYKISTKDDKNAFSIPWVVIEPSGKLLIEKDDPNGSYKLNEADSWQPIKITLREGNDVLDSQQMESLKFSADCDGLTVAAVPSGINGEYLIYVGKSGADGVVNAQAGNYTIKIDAEFTDALGETVKGSATHSIEISSADFDAKSQNLQEDKYLINDIDSWKPIKVEVSIDEGKPLSEAQMRGTELVLDSTTKISCKIEKDEKNSAFYIYPGKDKDGNTVKVKSGDYNVKATATYTDSSGNKVSDSITERINVLSANFEVSTNNKQPEGKYSMSDINSWLPIEVSMKLNTKKLTDEELASVSVEFYEKNEVEAYYEPIKGESKLNIFVARKEDGSFVEPPIGDQTLKATVIYTDAYGNENRQSISFDLHFKFDFLATAVQEQDWYVVSKKDEWKPIRVDLLLEGNKLSNEQLDSVKVILDLNEEVKYVTEPIYDESAVNVYIGKTEEGFETPECRKYKGVVRAEFVNSHGKTVTSEDKVSFEVRLISKWVIYLGILLVLFIILAIWLLFMSQKVLPKRIDKAPGMSEVNYLGNKYGENFVNVEYRRKNKSLRVSTRGVDGMSCAATFKLKAVDNRFTASKQRRIGIIGINSNCDTIMINGIEYVKHKSAWVKSTFLDIAGDDSKIPPMDYAGRNPMFDLSRQGMEVNTRVQNTK